MVFKKGNKLGGRTKGSLNKSTILKEERRAIFEEEASQIWIETIQKLPPTYIADQFMGKAPDKVEHTFVDVPTEKIKQLADDLLHRQGNS
jgi:hypothetical protein